ncbi:hypothetical protein C8A05DRAFT_34102, partial [Staphylotrichum tortipilum]
MPRASLPTPASSTDLTGQDGSKMASLQLAFELPPPAVSGEAGPSTTSATFYPAQASETVKSRRRSSAANPPKDQFALPPPPTRSRKIIQMKPREEPSPEVASSSASKTAAKGGNNGGSSGASSATAAAGGGTKRKQPSATSAAGRKIARKTAHSLIERRRRSKMNEEFAVLKSLIPACTGEMHKLAILQASIEYVRYLEDCVAKLKAQCGSEAKLDPEPTLPHSGLPSPALVGGDTYNPIGGYGRITADPDADVDADVDMDMDMEATASPTANTTATTSPAHTPSPTTASIFHTTTNPSRHPSISPALRPQQDTTASASTRHYHSYSSPALHAQQDPSSSSSTSAHLSRHNSYSSVSSEYRLHGHGGQGYTTSATTSPFFGPMGGHGQQQHPYGLGGEGRGVHHQQGQQQYTGGGSSYGGSALTSPALLP